MTRSAKAEDLVKKGDELDLIVTKVNDQEGVVYLSKKRLDENKGREAVAPPLSRAARSWRASSPRPTPAALWCW